jgi:thymidylate synthase (FAD)
MNTAKIVAITQPLIKKTNSSLPQYELDEYLSADEFIAYAARVSNPSNQMNTETSEKLLRYCIRNSHWSVFEMVNVVMQIDTTRDIARQILRHRSFSFQEFSQRYADPTEDLGFVTREARLQDTKNRQNSIEVDNVKLTTEWQNRQQYLISIVKEQYQWAIDNNIAKEQARSVLPEGLTVSRMYMNGNLRSWIHFCELRMGNGTQKEHREVASSAWDQLSLYFKFLTNKS